LKSVSTPALAKPVFVQIAQLVIPQSIHPVPAADNVCVKSVHSLHLNIYGASFSSTFEVSAAGSSGSTT
jgi:hypothetical protein